MKTACIGARHLKSIALNLFFHELNRIYFCTIHVLLQTDE